MAEYGASTFDVAAYLAERPEYPPCVYERIWAYHNQAGKGMELRAGQGKGTGMLLDLGCGPGQASWPLLDEFETVLGIDPGEGMIDSARAALEDLRASGRVKQSHERVQYQVGNAEQLAKLVDDNSVDMVVSATAAHWFDYEKLWPELERVTKSGATVAFWAIWAKKTYDVPYPADASQSLAHMISNDVYNGPMKEYLDQPGCSIIRSLYSELPLPIDQNNTWSDIRLETYPTTGASEYIPIMPQSVGSGDDSQLDHRHTAIGAAWDLRTETNSSWDALARAKRTTSSFARWQSSNPGNISQQEDPVAQQVARWRGTYMEEQRARQKGEPSTLAQQGAVRLMRPMGLLMLRRK